MTKINEDLDYINGTVRNTPINVHSMQMLGWRYEPDGPSAEGPTFSKGKYWCQKLVPGSVNVDNVGANPSYNLQIWISHGTQFHTLFLGRCPNLEHFIFICKLLLIDEGQENKG